MKISLRRIVFLLAASLVPLAVACTSGDVDEPAEPAAPAPPQPAASQQPGAPQPPAQPAAPQGTASSALPPPQPVVPAPIPPSRPAPKPSTDPQFGGTLRVVSVGSVQSFDPLWTTASATGNVSTTILEGLFSYTHDWALGPVLLDSWSSSPDGLTWTFKIRDGVKFHDGTPLTTKEVIGTLNRQKDRAPVFKLVWKEFGPETFEELVKAQDNLTFTINLQEPTLLAINALGPQNFAPQIITESWYTIPATESAPGTPVGTGPFKFDKWTPGDRWSAVRYTGYKPHSNPADGRSGGHVAYVDKVEWIEIPDQTARVAALQVGQLDMAQEFPADLIPRLENDPNVVLYANPPNRLLGHFNHVRPPFNNPQVRQALVIAYRNADALLLAAGDPNFMRLCPSLMQCGSAWESAAGAEGFYAAEDLERARQLVRDAGFEGAKVRLMDPVDRQPAHGAALVTREVLESLGFDVDFQVMDWATMVSQRARPDEWEFFHTWSGVTVRSGPVGHLMFGELQYDAWFNEYQDVSHKQRDLFGQLARSTSEEDQKRLMDEFQQYFYEDAIFLQVGEFFSKWAAREEVKGLFSGEGGQGPFNVWLDR